MRRSKKPKPTELSPADKRELARLVRKYGEDLIARAAELVPTPRSGPPRDPAKWDDLVWIKERADDLTRERAKKRGVELHPRLHPRFGLHPRYAPGALKQAMCERFEQTFTSKRQRTSEKCWKQFQKRIKNARDEWRVIERKLKDWPSLRDYRPDLYRKPTKPPLN